MAFTVVGTLAATGVLGFVLAGRRDEFETALTQGSIAIFAVTVLLMIFALL